MAQSLLSGNSSYCTLKKGQAKERHGVPKDVSRRSLKTLLQSEIPDIEFHKPKKVNEPDRISIKDTRDAAIQIVEDMKNVCNDQMKGLYDAAANAQESDQQS
ncbi:hypothetical protein OS493_000713 [Desmophyllum pertusum]|uniref:Uncharacterized protein n=1 Tax=Desmophyllum pertusum TaxID=174260 RepID=A0A9X0A7J8_9CNID|nr:hypothetical protein OS493_000713 [Desmophyllum pertusum]